MTRSNNGTAAAEVGRIGGFYLFGGAIGMAILAWATELRLLRLLKWAALDFIMPLICRFSTFSFFVTPFIIREAAAYVGEWFSTFFGIVLIPYFVLFCFCLFREHFTIWLERAAYI